MPLRSIRRAVPSWSFALFLPLLIVACAAPGVGRGRTTTPSPRPLGPVSIVVGELGQPPVSVATASTQAAGLQTLQSGQRRIDHAERRLLAHFERGVADRVMSARDLGPQGAPDPAFLVSYRLTSFEEHLDGPDGRCWAGYIFGSITAGLGWLIAIECHVNTTSTYEFEVRVFDVRGAPMLRVPQSDGTVANVYDSSVAAPVLRRTYSGSMHTWTGLGTTPGGEDLERFLEAQGDELARQMFDLSAEDVASAVARASASPPPPPSSPDPAASVPAPAAAPPAPAWPQPASPYEQAPTSGGEAP